MPYTDDYSGVLALHPVEQWVGIVLAALDLAADPKSVSAYCLKVGICRSTFRERCVRVGIKPKATVDFARLLRARVLQDTRGIPLLDTLDVAETRTLKRLLAKAGGTSPITESVEAFCRSQQFVPQGQCIDALLVTMRGRRLSSSRG